MASLENKMEQSRSSLLRSASIPSRNSNRVAPDLGQSPSTPPGSPTVSRSKKPPMPAPRPPPKPVAISHSSDSSQSLNRKVLRKSFAQSTGNPPVLPPVVPPRPSPVIKPPPTRFTAVKRERLSEPLSFLEFEKRYLSQLPLQIEVLQGYRGPTPELSISTCDVYNVHFKKYHDVVVVGDEAGHTYSIPIGSALKFGLLYTPMVKAGEVFDTVSDILAHDSKFCVKVICATSAWSGGVGKTSPSVEEGEVLVIKKHKRGAIKVFSLGSKSKKLLPGKCKGFFTTDPSLCKLYLMEILEYIPDAIPCKAKLFLGGESSQMESVPAIPRLGAVSLLKRTKEASLVASSVNDNGVQVEAEDIHGDESTESSILLDIPLDDVLAQVEVVVVSDLGKTENLYENTRKLFENFDATKLTPIKDAGSQKEYETQSLFYEKVRGKYVNLGVSLERPQTLYRESANNNSQQPTAYAIVSLLPSTDVHSSDSDDSYEEVDGKSDGAPSTPVLPLHPTPKPSLPSPRRQRTAPPEPQGARRQQESTPESGDRFRGTESQLPSKEASNQHSELIAQTTRPLLPPPKRIYTPAPVSRRLSSQLQGGEDKVPSLNRSEVQVPPEEDYENPDLANQAASQVSPQSDSEQANGTQGAQNGYVHMNPSVRTFLPDLHQQLEAMRAEIKNLRESVENTKANQEVAKEDEAVKENKRYLATLSVGQVIQMLDAMGLAKYQAAFSEYLISGDLLLELDESVLESELGVDSKIHRIRLMKVIMGTHSAKELIERQK